jgi:hypothetical protein
LPLEDAAPERLLEQIEARIDARSRLKHISRTLRASEGDWIKVSPGARIKILHRMPEISRRTISLDIEPGAFYPAHTHEQDEEIFMISGDLSVGDLGLGLATSASLPRAAAIRRTALALVAAASFRRRCDGNFLGTDSKSSRSVVCAKQAKRF